MLGVTRLLAGTVAPGDALRYGRSTRESPPHLLHYSQDKKPIVVWNSTRRCNLHCGHCYSDSHDQDYPGELTTAEGRRLIADLADFGVPTVLFSGGEPLVRPDLIELATEANAAGMRTVLSSNGTLLDEHKARQIADAGFSYVGISLDGIGPTHDKLRGMHGAFDGAVRGLTAAREAGIRTGIRITLHRRNHEQLGELFELAEQLQVNRLCLYHLAYAGRAARSDRLNLGHAETRAAIEEVFDLAEDLARRDVDIEVLTVDNPADAALLLMRVQETQPDRAADVEQMLRWNGGNQSGIAVACIDPLGRVHPDQFSWGETVGHVRRRRFSEIWTDANPLLAKYRRRPRDLDSHCLECRFYDFCNGGLRVRAMSATGDFSAPDPACYLTREEIAA